MCPKTGRKMAERLRACLPQWGESWPQPPLRVECPQQERRSGRPSSAHHSFKQMRGAKLKKRDPSWREGAYNSSARALSSSSQRMQPLYSSGWPVSGDLSFSNFRCRMPASRLREGRGGVVGTHSLRKSNVIIKKSQGDWFPTNEYIQSAKKKQIVCSIFPQKASKKILKCGSGFGGGLVRCSHIPRRYRWPSRRPLPATSARNGVSRPLAFLAFPCFSPRGIAFNVVVHQQNLTPKKIYLIKHKLWPLFYGLKSSFFDRKRREICVFATI